MGCGMSKTPHSYIEREKFGDTSKDQGEQRVMRKTRHEGGGGYFGRDRFFYTGSGAGDGEPS